MNHSSLLTEDVARAQQGDMQAYTRLIQACQNMVSTIALAIVKDIDDSEEVAQQVFISAWQNLHQLKNSASFLPWIRQSTRYTAFNFLRDAKSKSTLDSAQADILLEHIADPSPHEDEVLTREQTNRVLQAFIEQLPQDDREIVLLYYREEQSSKQVAQLLEISESNVRKKLSRVRQSLKADILKRASHLAYCSAPGLAFSSVVSALLVPSAPAGAAVAAAAVGSKSGSSLFIKVVTALGGAFIGAFLAIFAIIWSSNTAIKSLPKQHHRLLVKRYRNENIAWVILFALSFTLAIQFTQGWIAPMLSFTVFIIGFAAMQIRQMSLLNQHAVLKNKRRIIKSPRTRAILTYCCLALACICSAAGAIIGLIAAGRFA